MSWQTKLVSADVMSLSASFLVVIIREIQPFASVYSRIYHSLYLTQQWLMFDAVLKNISLSSIPLKANTIHIYEYCRYLCRCNYLYECIMFQRRKGAHQAAQKYRRCQKLRKSLVSLQRGPLLWSSWILFYYLYIVSFYIEMINQTQKNL